MYGVKGTFPASRSYVLPMREFVRALEDSGAADGSELPFKAGDLILPLGKVLFFFVLFWFCLFENREQWDETSPSVPGVIMKGRVISPTADPERVGWFSTHAVEYVANFDKARQEGINVKRKMLEVSDVARDLARERSDPEVLLFENEEKVL